MPARYGGRLSSVLDIATKDGDMESYKVDGGIGLLASRLAVQGPIARDKSSFLFTARRTYADLLTRPFQGKDEGLPYFFYDFNGKLTYKLSARNALYLSSYYGRDIGGLNLSGGRFRADFNWGNATATARWHHVVNDKLSFDLSALFSRYSFSFDWEYGGFYTRVSTGIKDLGLKADFTLQPDERHQLRYGLQYTNHALQPRAGAAESAEGLVFSTNQVRRKQAHESAFYLSDDWQVNERLLVSAGVRGSYFALTGPYTLYRFDGNEQVMDSVRFTSGERVETYQALEPRFSLRYKLSADKSIKAGYTQATQYLHLVSSAYTTLPLDVWVPSSSLVPPQRASQYALGYYQEIGGTKYEASVELYYKDLQHQLEYRQGYAPGPSNRDLEYEFVQGKGESYGIELFVRKNHGDLQGWLGYTLAYTNRTFPDLNQGKTFPARFDRRHDVSLVSTYAYNPRWTFGATFTYATGLATTLPERAYILEGKVNYQYGRRNSFRMQPAHRLDLSATLHGKTGKKIKSDWIFSVYNVYGRRNPLLYYLDHSGDAYDGDINIQAKKVSVVPFPLPSVTWNFSFL